KQFDGKLRANITDQYRMIDNLNQRGSDELKRLRDATSTRLSAYEDRQGDPFYKLLNVDADVWDDGDSYTITARIPVHERDHLTINFKGDNSVVLSGARRNEEELKLADGRTRGTNAYQSFFEAIPLDYPVDARSLTREAHGDTLIFRVNKQGPHAKRGGFQAQIPKRVTADRPDFPKNLPLPDAPPKAEDEKEDGPIPPSKAMPGSRPLG
ncbi:MAG TPA: Hsp20/alpha crystallin family protein, partial [Bdellovibrionota bacterium]|nr:Hsp20/alpha crystallin family protein [Bdellovibrionota bacterium]